MKTPKKILIITYYWPPSGGPGVQRWLKFVKYLPEFNWKPTVYIPKNPSYPIIDETLNNEVKPEVEIIKKKIWEPYQLAEIFGRENKKFKAGQFDIDKNQSWKSRLSIWIRGNLFIPDARLFWVNPSVKYLEKLLQEQQFDIILTTGPPHSIHLIGLGLKKIFPHIKWVADFRDPWTEISYYKHLKLTKLADRKHRKLESKVLNTADITLATSFSDAENFYKMGANAVCITNGFDVDARTDVSNTVNASTEKFVLSYIGVLEQLRNPEILWNVLNDLVSENQDFKKDFELKFVGRIDNKILEPFQHTPLEAHIRNMGYLSHSAANEEMKNSSILIVTNFPNDSSKGIIPGKIFEYLVTGHPIISFGPKSADVEKILDKTQSGKHFLYSDEQALKAYILNAYRLWKAGKLTVESKNIDEFSRKNLTKKLSELLDSLA